MENLLTPQDVAKVLKITVAKVNELCRKRMLKCVQVNSRVRRFAEQQIADFIQSQTVGSDEPCKTPVAIQPRKVVRSAREKRVELDEPPGGDESDLKKLRKEIRELWR